MIAVGARREYTAHWLGTNAGTTHSKDGRRCERERNLRVQQDARPFEQGASRYAATWDRIASGKEEHHM